MAKEKSSSAIEAAALADQLKGLISGRAPVSSLIKAINIFKPTKKAEGGEVKKYMGGGSVKKTPTTKRSIGPAGASTVKSKDDVGQTKGPAGMGKMITTKGWGASRKT
jgi:hypothetical protein